MLRPALHYQPAARRQRKLGHNGRRLLPVDCQVNSTADSKNKGIKRPGKLYRRLTEGPQESYSPSQTKTFTNSRKKAKITAIFHRVYKTRQYGTPPQSLLLLAVRINKIAIFYTVSEILPFLSRVSKSL